MLPDVTGLKNGVFIGEKFFYRTLPDIAGSIFWLQAKSKTTEAKIQLSSVYTTMESMLLEYDTYATCLSAGGYNPSPDFKNRFYGIGFAQKKDGSGEPDLVAKDNGLASCINGSDCTSASCTGTHFFFGGGKTAAGFSGTGSNVNNAVAGMVAPMVADPTQTTFSAGASGAISNSALADRWSIDNTKKLSHVQAGY